MNIELFNRITMIIFIVCYSYQFIYMLISLFPTNMELIDDKKNKFAILIAARNEEKVIGNLLKSINNQDYPKSLIDIYVGADNCTDDTARIAKENGAVVYERFNHIKVGKGYVLNFLLDKIKDTNKVYDGYIVFDADNILDKNFIKEINRVFNLGYDVVTSFRNSKNYGDNWLSAGYGLWYLHESCHLNEARMRVGASCSVSGTGFLFSQRIINDYNGWNFYLLTEDIEFTVSNVVNRYKTGYANKAILFDEQPTNFKESYYQRLRWSKGYLQVFEKYGLDLVKGIFKGDFSSYDMTMNYAPAAILTFTSLIVNLYTILKTYLLNESNYYLFTSLGKVFGGMLLTLLVISILTTLTQWNKIYCPNYKKILYMFTCPLFLLTYIPICIIALFKKVTWKPIEHNRVLTLDQIRK